MTIQSWQRSCFVAFFLAACHSCGLQSASAIPSFQSANSRLPNPDRPYEMVGATVHYNSAPHFSVYDLEFAPSNVSQLAFPTRNSDGSLEFDSTFDITYKAVISFSTQPPHTVSGIGRARALGFAPADSNHAANDFLLPNAQVFDTELVEFSLFALSPIPEVMFRESPSLRSSGITIRENACPVCASPTTFWRISSFFDIATEITFNGGNTWTAARDLIHVEQSPDGFPPGDYNKDKVVDSADYVVWRHSFGQTGAGLAADGNWSGQVDAGDYAVWKANVGEPNSSGAIASAAVPEPASVVLVALGILAIVRGGRRGLV